MGKIIGIYKIISIDKVLYVGQSRDISHRISTHKSELKHNKHSNIILQRMHNKGYEMQFQIVESNIPIEQLTSKELFFINILKPICNIAIPAENDSWTFTDYRNKKISISSTGKKKSESHKLNISIGRKAAIKDRPEDFVHLSNPWNKGAGNYMVGDKNHFYGKHHSEKTKKILSEKNKRYNIDIDEIVKLRHEGYTFEKISKLLGGTRKIIAKRYYKHETNN